MLSQKTKRILGYIWNSAYYVRASSLKYRCNRLINKDRLSWVLITLFINAFCIFIISHYLFILLSKNDEGGEILNRILIIIALCIALCAMCCCKFVLTIWRREFGCLWSTYFNYSLSLELLTILGGICSFTSLHYSKIMPNVSTHSISFLPVSEELLLFFSISCLTNIIINLYLVVLLPVVYGLSMGQWLELMRKQISKNHTHNGLKYREAFVYYKFANHIYGPIICGGVAFASGAMVLGGVCGIKLHYPLLQLGAAIMFVFSSTAFVLLINLVACCLLVRYVPPTQPQIMEALFYEKHKRFK